MVKVCPLCAVVSISNKVTATRSSFKSDLFLIACSFNTSENEGDDFVDWVWVMAWWGVGIVVLWVNHLRGR